MNNVYLTIEKSKVYEEVAQTTSYTGAKKTDDETAYDRIFTTDEDRSMLERFWQERKDTAVDHLKRFVHYEAEEDGVWTLQLRLPDQSDPHLQGSMERSLYSFLVLGITANWYAFTNKEEVSSYVQDTAAELDTLLRLAYHRRRPTRPER